MATTGDADRGYTASGATPAAPAPPAPGGGPPGGPPDDRDARRRIQDALAGIERDLAALDPDFAAERAELYAIQQALLRDLAALDRAGTTPQERDAAAQDADRAQAAYTALRGDLERAGLDVRREELASQERQAAADRALRGDLAGLDRTTSLELERMRGTTQREIAGLQVGGSLVEAQLRDATDRARLQWEQEQGRIEEALANRRLTFEQAAAAAREGLDRINLELTHQRNQIEAAGLEVSQRGQELTAATTQRGQDIEAGLTQRGQDVGRANQFVQSGSSLLGQAMQTASSIGANTGQTALGALPFVAPPGTGQYVNALRAGQPNPAPPGPMAFPFDPLRIVQDAAAAAYGRYAPPGQQLLGMGTAPIAPFVAPPQVAAPPRVAVGGAPLQLPPQVLRPLGGGGFTAPVTGG